MNKASFDRELNREQLVNNVLFIANDDFFEQLEMLQKNIEQAIARSDLNLSRMMSPPRLMKATYDHLDIILSMPHFFFLACHCGKCMASAVGINILERKRKIFVLPATDSTPLAIDHVFRRRSCTMSIVLGLLFPTH